MNNSSGGSGSDAGALGGGNKRMFFNASCPRFLPRCRLLRTWNQICSKYTQQSSWKFVFYQMIIRMWALSKKHKIPYVQTQPQRREQGHETEWDSVRKTTTNRQTDRQTDRQKEKQQNWGQTEGARDRMIDAPASTVSLSLRRHDTGGIVNLQSLFLGPKTALTLANWFLLQCALNASGAWLRCPCWINFHSAECSDSMLFSTCLHLRDTIWCLLRDRWSKSPRIRSCNLLLISSLLSKSILRGTTGASGFCPIVFQKCHNGKWNSQHVCGRTPRSARMALSKLSWQLTLKRSAHRDQKQWVLSSHYRICETREIFYTALFVVPRVSSHVQTTEQLQSNRRSSSTGKAWAEYPILVFLAAVEWERDDCSLSVGRFVLNAVMCPYSYRQKNLQKSHTQRHTHIHTHAHWYTHTWETWARWTRWTSLQYLRPKNTAFTVLLNCLDTQCTKQLHWSTWQMFSHWNKKPPLIVSFGVAHYGKLCSSMSMNIWTGIIRLTHRLNLNVPHSLRRCHVPNVRCVQEDLSGLLAYEAHDQGEFWSFSVGLILCWINMCEYTRRTRPSRVHPCARSHWRIFNVPNLFLGFRVPEPHWTHEAAERYSNGYHQTTQDTQKAHIAPKNWRAALQL